MVEEGERATHQKWCGRKAFALQRPDECQSKCTVMVAKVTLLCLLYATVVPQHPIQKSILQVINTK